MISDSEELKILNIYADALINGNKQVQEDMRTILKAIELCKKYLK